MLLLAIETSCDETAAAVMQVASNSVRLLSNVMSSQIKLHTKTGGVVPEVAARAHIENILPVITLSLKKAKIQLNQIDTIAVTAGPGLATSLMVGVDTAKGLAQALGKPLIAINHIEAHIYSPFLKNSQFAIRNSQSYFPAISLVVSGGHTDLFLVKDFLNYKKIGQTMDDAAGECFDKCARLLRLPYPGGPALSKLAQTGNPKAITFPRPMINSNDFNFSFSGLKTAVLYYLRDNSPFAPSLKKRGRGGVKTDLAASIQAAIVDVLTAKTIAAVKKYKAKTILLGGGVAANSALRHKLRATSYPPERTSSVRAGKLPAKFLVAEPEFCTDNAGMIAFAAALRARKKLFTPLQKVRANANWELK